ncbi:hypothetical protein AVEN_95536-1 [Araneus ventricosus]|uniref:Uncharacterized protein n=1 Tax=Araneus ventricosus TaxID=182803 RepID=A0A4Y2SJF6_ARAVE|nr:hypothetical protein AVEN_95536-1 [Araneus ventricosus]
MISPKRSEDNFAAFMQEGHQVGKSPLADLKVGLVSQFPLDPMHLLHLRVTRKLILYWIRNGDRKSVNSVSSTLLLSDAISERLLILAENMPSEFN